MFLKKEQPKEIPGEKIYRPKNNIYNGVQSPISLTEEKVKDLHQSEIVLNYLEDKFTTEQPKKRVKFTSLC